MLQVDVNKVWLSFSSVFLAFVFVFGNSLRNMYESVIFLFVMHPYDVGDALFISSDWCQVEEIALQYTQVVRYDGVKIWYPNYVLCAGAVMNITRSAKRWESFKVSKAVCVDSLSCCYVLCSMLEPSASTQKWKLSLTMHVFFICWHSVQHQLQSSHILMLL